MTWNPTLEERVRALERAVIFDTDDLTSGVALDVAYLRLNTTNAPLTGALPITVDSTAALDVKTAAGVSVLKVDTINMKTILSDGAGHGMALWVTTS